MGPTIPITRRITTGLLDGQSTASHLAAHLLLIALMIAAIAVMPNGTAHADSGPATTTAQAQAIAHVSAGQDTQDLAYAAPSDLDNYDDPDALLETCTAASLTGEAAGTAPVGQYAG